MNKYGKVSANKLWFKNNDTIEYVFHNSPVVIEDEKDNYLLCYFPYLNDKFWVSKETIEVL